MRLVSYRSEGGSGVGVQAASGILDAGALLGEGPMGARRLIDDGRLDELAELAKLEGEVEPASAIKLLPRSPTPTRSSASGSTTASTRRRPASTLPSSPPSSPSSGTVAPDGATVALPAASEKVDYEAEIAFVLGRRCKEVDAAEALDAVAGYMLLNDLSARDLQFATRQWMPGKVFDGSAPCGPALVTPDQAGQPDAISFSPDLNGERMQRHRRQTWSSRWAS